MKIRNYILSVSLGISLCASAQDKLKVNVNTFGLVTSNESIVPHYQHANNWGVVSPLDNSNFFLQASASYQIFDHDRFSLKAGLGGVAKNNIGDSFLQEAFVSGKAFSFIDFSVGKETFSPVSYNDELTVGGFLYNSNARPIPRVTFGIYDYLPLPFTNDWLAIKGGMSHGLLDDDRTSSGHVYSADNVLLHEKWAYGRFGKGKIQPYIGIMHSALMGGVRPNGDKILIDYWASFFAGGSETLGGGDATNAAGAHEGFWDFGVYTNIGEHGLHAYYQKPFADGSGMNLWNLRNKDFKLGVIADVKDFNWVKKFSIEFVRTDYQSGPGTPDPYYPVSYNGHSKGSIIWRSDIEDDLDGFMSEVYGQEVPSGGWTMDQVWRHIEVAENQGHKFGGRDDYNNNGSYYNGWTYNGQNIGFPLYHTYDIAKSYSPGWEARNRVVLMNTRVRAFHFGLEGNLSRQLEYLFKTTITNNFGSYNEEYVTRESWTEAENFFYKGGKTQVYSYLQLLYNPSKLKNIQLNTSFAYDGGQLYNSFGWSLGVRYTPFN